MNNLNKMIKNNINKLTQNEAGVVLVLAPIMVVCITFFITCVVALLITGEMAYAEETALSVSGASGVVAFILMVFAILRAE